MTSLPDLSAYPLLAIDVETTGLNWRTDKMFGAAAAWSDHYDGKTVPRVNSVYVDIRDSSNLEWLRGVVKTAKLIVNHNIKFDAHFMREALIKLDYSRLDCTMIREALIDEHRQSYSLDAIALDRLGIGKDDTLWAVLADQFGGAPTKKEQIGNLPRADVAQVGPYACRDAELALQIWLQQSFDIAQDDLVHVADIERRLLARVIKMEERGVRVDVKQAERVKRALDLQMAKDTKQLCRLAGFKVNVNSNAHIAKIIKPYKTDDGYWRAKDGTVLETTDKGAPSIRAAALNNMAFDEARLIAAIRAASKASDLFIGKYILEMNNNGYVHASINQTKTEYGTGTYTGRFSITEPALQQINKRDKTMAAAVRSLFLPDPGQLWGSFDWEQMDFRMFAHYANDPSIINTYQLDANADFHSIVAKLTGLPRNRDNKTGGANAKQINLAMVFGMGQGQLAAEMGLPYTVDERGYKRAGDEAIAVFNRYHDAIPGVRAFLNQVEAVARSRGYILTPLGRKIRFPNPAWAYKAAGLLFQGAAADALKIKMIELCDMLDGSGSRLMITVHDEFNLSMPDERRSHDITKLLQEFDGSLTPIKFRVPIVSKGRLAANWWEASK